jgi:acetylornithine deacetylase/succinyl-diaminopimelate desuccinylase-like protein
MLPKLTSQDWSKLADEAVDFLRQLVQIPTINPAFPSRDYPSVGETMACELIREKLKADGISSQILAKVPGRGNIIARLAGDRSAKPLLLAGHLDVVGIDPDWTPGIDPFGAMMINGRMYGRGTADMKSIVTMHVMTMLAVKRSGIKLKRDLIFAGVAGEEWGSAVGMRWLIDHHWHIIEAEFALNEGLTGGPQLDDDQKVSWVGLEAAEKRILVARIIATGSSGHASSAQPDNAIYRLAVALQKLKAHPRPLVLNPVSAAFVKAMRMYFGVDPLEDPTPRIRAMFQDTVVPTLLGGGRQMTVLPDLARTTVVCRLLPTTDAGEFQNWLESVVAERGVYVNYLALPGPSAPLAKPNTALVKAYTSAVQRRFCGVPVLLTQGTGTDDNFYLRQKGVQAYGIHPLVDPEPENMHGPNESIPIDAFREGLPLIMETVLELAT